MSDLDKRIQSSEQNKKRLEGERDELILALDEAEAALEQVILDGGLSWHIPYLRFVSLEFPPGTLRLGFVGFRLGD